MGVRMKKIVLLSVLGITAGASYAHTSGLFASTAASIESRRSTSALAPHESLMATIAALRANDTRAFLRSLVTEDEFAQAKKEWEQSRRQLFDAKEEAEFRAAMEMLTAPGAEKALMAEIEPALAELRPQLAMLVGMASGMGQVMFLGAPEAGLGLLAAILVADRRAGLWALCGSGVGVYCSLLMGLSTPQALAGLDGYNPALAALALSQVHRSALAPALGIALAIACRLAFDRLGLAPLTMPFILSCWAVALGTRLAQCHFGVRHAWADQGGTFHTREQVEALAAPLHLEYIEEGEGESPTALDGMQYWHQFSLIVRKD